MSSAKSALFLIALLCSPVLANVVDHYQIGMHRFTIRDSGSDAPVQQRMSTPYAGASFAGVPVFNPRYVVCF